MSPTHNKVNRERWRDVERTLFTLLVGLLLITAIQVSTQWPARASIIVWVLGTIGVFLVIIQVTSDIKRVVSGGKKIEALTMEAPAAVSAGRWGNVESWAWIVGFFALIHVVGFLYAVPLYVFLYTKFYGSGWFLSAALGAGAWGFVYAVFDAVLHVPWPKPLIVSLFL